MAPLLVLQREQAPLALPEPQELRKEIRPVEQAAEQELATSLAHEWALQEEQDRKHMDSKAKPQTARIVELDLYQHQTHRQLIWSLD